MVVAVNDVAPAGRSRGTTIGSSAPGASDTPCAPPPPYRTAPSRPNTLTPPGPGTRLTIAATCTGCAAAGSVHETVLPAATAT